MSRITEIPDGVYDLVIYTDGAFSNSRNRGGYAFVVKQGDKYTHRFLRGVDDTTNQRTEMLAVISVFRYLLNKKSIPKTVVVTDSMYVVGTTCNNWKINANKDLWAIYMYLYEQVKEHVDFMHVRGHQGIEGNELCDTLAVIAGG